MVPHREIAFLSLQYHRCRLLINLTLVFTLIFLFNNLQTATSAEIAKDHKTKNDSLSTQLTATEIPIELTPNEKQWVKNHSIIRVHNEMNQPPFNFNQENRPKGYSIDYMSMVASRLGLVVEYMSGPSRQEAFGMLKKGDIDIMLNVVNDRELSDSFLFTAPYLNATMGIYALPENKTIQSLNDLSSKKVAVSKDSRSAKMLAQYYPDIKITNFDNNEQCLEAVALHNVDAAIGEIGLFNHKIRETFLTSIRLIQQIQDKRFSSKMAFAIYKEHPILRDILQKAINSITPKELQDIQVKWISEPTRKNSHSLKLSNGDLKFLASIEEIKMCVNPDWMPMDYIDPNGKHTGIGDTIVNLLRQDLDVPIRLVKTSSWVETVEFFKARKCDIIPNTTQAKERSSYMDFTQPYLDVPILIATGNDKNFLDDMERLRGQKLAILKGYNQSHKLQSKYPDIDFIEVESSKQGLEKVQNGSVYGFIDALAVIVHAIEQYGMIDLRISGRMDERLQFRIAVRKDWPRQVLIFNKILGKIGKDKFHEIYHDHITVKMVEENNFSYLAKYLAVMMAIIGFVVYRNFQLRTFNKKLKHLSITDPLTNIYNRKQLDDVLAHEIGRSMRYGHEFSLIIADIDWFKRVNDNHGHLVGDQVLIAFVELLQIRLRESDTLGRWGGEEFMIICPETNLENAQKLAELLRQTIEESHLPHKDNLTASFGVTSYRIGDSDDDIVKRADDALYLAKDSGRNLVLTSD